MISTPQPSVDSFWCVVPAAGIGQRMNADIPKQYLPLNSKTVIEHTLEKLLRVNQFSKIVVALNSNDVMWSSLSISKNDSIQKVAGGKERSDSVLSALINLEGKAKASDWVLVHDAARPCVSPDNINTMIQQLSDNDVGGILALPVSDTLKKAQGASDKNTSTEKNRIKKTVIDKTIDRDDMWQAQTPQMFRYGLLKQALQQAQDEQYAITDEASAIERLGYSPVLVLGEKDNIKITHPDDLWLAEMILTKQQQVQQNT